MKKMTARDHAFIYGVIAEETLKMSEGLRGPLVKGIITYGNQRGARMAQLAKMYGEETSMKNYLAFGEWSPAPGEMDVRIPQKTPSSIWNVHKCPWNAEWKEDNMLKMGEIYCKYVDAALVKGFNKNLDLGLDTNQSKGDEFCYFKWNGADMTDENSKSNAEIQKKVGNDRIRSWEYHCAHIYKTLRVALEQEMDSKVFEQLFKTIDGAIEKKLGKEVVALMHAGLLIDFWVCPSGKNAELVGQLF